MALKVEPAVFDLPPGSWEVLPLRFSRLDAMRVLVTSIVGEHVVLTSSEFEDLMGGRLSDSGVLARLRAKHIIRLRGESLPLDLLAVKMRTQYARLAEFTSLHLFVVTLRCEHACGYCQVSRRGAARHRFDMSRETADRALEVTFRSPSPHVKIEFQGGEPLLNFDLIKYVVTQATMLNEQHGRDLSFVIATNLALLSDEVLRFCSEHGIGISTSLDGPADLHNANRPRPGGDSYEKTVAGIRRVQAELGPGRVSALMTTTERTLSRVEEVIDTYVELGLGAVFLRPISPYGFAVRTRSHAAYDVNEWLTFYRAGLQYIMRLNAQGVDIMEVFASIVLTKMLSNADPGYVDLTSPAGIGIKALVYNYDGDVYASDEGRMLAEMGDTTFRLGNLARDSYEDLMTSDALLDPLDTSIAVSAPMCSDCAFETWCGADPVYHHTTSGDFLGRKPSSAFCQRNMGVFRLLLELYHGDRFARELFHRWAGR